MTDGFPNKPKILRGAFVEFGLSLPPLLVVFQFNPVQLTRNRGLSYSFPGAPDAASKSSAVPQRTLRNFHGGFSNLLSLQKEQLVTVEEQKLGFDIRLDATDRLNEGDTITEQFGIAPQIATLELMTYPKRESLLGSLADLLPVKPKGFSFTRSTNPPLILFIFGRKRVLPVNINTMNITETEFSTDLNPVRATVAVSLTVIEGKSVPYLYSKAMTEGMSVLNLANITDVANVVVPG
ncbi:hypothetical protein [Streptomyces sp. H27-D2]|uniref:hypothetical protein n=1 Tax=Streptomyces sp. H27-D2 TaxID=3046304 RepID=UPI002DB78520|nr:hypothetical protein [Streptomyces sp. H27-D2]MEC4018803.1 hypothetical protein [Streptomyces sp. H27-D2]